MIRSTVLASLLALAPCSALPHHSRPAGPKTGPRTQLSIGYSLLYQEADGIPKFKWLLLLKNKPEEMARITDELASYYGQLADQMRTLATKNPAMRIDVEPMSKIEADTRKAIGADLAKDMAPVAGKSGVEFEREALLMFYNSLNEQRHLVGVMLDLETDPGLKEFLRTTREQLDTRYKKVGATLSRRYFTH